MSLEQKMSDFFKFEENDTDMQGEIRAGITTFLTMAYILLVNPAMLAVSGIPCLLYTSPSPRDRQKSRMPSSA